MPLLPEDVPALGPQPLPAPAKQKSGTVDRTGTDRSHIEIELMDYVKI